jgi:para-nitrobenzyl esterase
VGREFGLDGTAFLARYRVENFPTPKDALAQVTGDTEFICEAVRLGHLVSRTGTPVYLYSFEYVVDGLLASNRVIHGLGTNFIFGNDFVGANPAPHVLNAEDRTLADAMGLYWTRFAASGDPNAPASNAVRWPTFDGRAVPGTDRERYLAFDSVIREGVGLRKAQCDFLEPFFFRSVVGGVPASAPR